MDQEIVNVLVKIVELKDETTAAHTWRVTLYAKALAEAFDLPPAEVARIMQGAVLHDIGKIDIPYEILAKPGRLTDEEYEIIKTHAKLGWERLVRMGEDDPVILAMVRSHHEHLDGTGYPDGLAGDDIHLAARKFSVIDTFDAMTSLRPYRKVTGIEAARMAIEELNANVGTQYCPLAVRQFTTLFESGELDWILEYFNDAKSMESLSLTSAPHVNEVHVARSSPLK